MRLPHAKCVRWRPTGRRWAPSWEGSPQSSGCASCLQKRISETQFVKGRSGRAMDRSISRRTGFAQRSLAGHLGRIQLLHPANTPTTATTLKMRLKPEKQATGVQAGLPLQLHQLNQLFVLLELLLAGQTLRTRQSRRLIESGPLGKSRLQVSQAHHGIPREDASALVRAGRNQIACTARERANVLQ